MIGKTNKQKPTTVTKKKRCKVGMLKKLSDFCKGKIESCWGKTTCEPQPTVLQELLHRNVERAFLFFSFVPKSPLTVQVYTWPPWVVHVVMWSPWLVHVVTMSGHPEWFTRSPWVVTWSSWGDWHHEGNSCSSSHHRWTERCLFMNWSWSEAYSWSASTTFTWLCSPPQVWLRLLSLYLYSQIPT